LRRTAVEPRQQSLSVSAAVAPTSALAVAPTPPADATLLASQREVKAKSGKRRIIPAIVGSDAGTTPVNVFPVEVPAPVLKKPRQDAGTFAVPASNGVAQNAFHPRGGGGLGNAAAQRAPPGFVPPPPPLYKPSVIGLNMMLLPSENGGVAMARAIDTQLPPTLLEAVEQHGSSRGGGHMVSCTVGDKVMWRDYYPLLSPVSLLAGSADKFVAVGTADGMLFLYSAASGRRLVPPIALDSAPYLLEAHVVKDRWYTLVVSRSGLCSVFDVKAKKLVCARSAAPLLARPVDLKGETPDNEDGATRAEVYRSISIGRVTDQGEPLLILSDSHAFFYSRDLCSWLRVADDAAPNSEYTRGSSSVPDRVGLLRSLQASAASSRRTPTLSGMGDLRRSAVETLAHLETLLESSVALSSPEDYRYYLTNYAAKLATAAEDDVENSDLRLRELCDLLLCIDSKTPEDYTVLGMNSRTLLRDVVLSVIAGKTSMQRLVSEYLESLDALERRQAT
jgi:TUP1-like enhancer of split